VSTIRSLADEFHVQYWDVAAFLELGGVADYDENAELDYATEVLYRQQWAAGPEHLTLWVRNAAWNGGAWTDTALHSTKTTYLNGIVTQSAHPWLRGAPDEAGPEGWAVLGFLPVQHVVVVPAGVTPDPSWVGSDCRIDDGRDINDGHDVDWDYAFPCPCPLPYGHARWWHQSGVEAAAPKVSPRVERAGRRSGRGLHPRCAGPTARQLRSLAHAANGQTRWPA